MFRSVDGLDPVAIGDVDRPFFVRSAAKPFQALVALDVGASLTDQQLAVACSSHGGFPAHVAYVRSILEEAGLHEDMLRTPPDWPLDREARDHWVVRGKRPAPIFHNCSGKHAAMLAACRAAGWEVATYTDQEHPLQLRIRELWEDLTKAPVDAVGVDGCGAPVFTTTVRQLAGLYARLAAEPRFERVWWAMHRYPALAASNGRIDERIGKTIDAAAKIGAEGCIGVAIRHHGGAVVKSWDGTDRGMQAGIIGLLRLLGMAVGAAADRLVPGPAVLGGGTAQGSIELKGFDVHT